MKCPECSRNQPYRSGMVCLKCGYTFILNPKTDFIAGQPIGDARMRAILRRASANGTRSYTLNQLFVAANRHMERVLSRGKIWKLLIGFILGLVVIMTIRNWSRMEDVVLLVPLCAMTLLSVTSALKRHHGKVTRRSWDKVVSTWQREDAGLPGLITEPALHSPPPEAPEKDIYDHGIQRLLICQHDLQVDLLVLNEFHAQEACLVIAESGYPHYLKEQVETILREQPELPIFLWHDATAAGEGMAERIRSGTWAAGLTIGEHPLHSLGPTRAQVKQSRRLRRLAKINKKHVPADAFLHGQLFATLATGMTEIHRPAWENHVVVSHETEVDWDAELDAGDGDGE